MLSDTGAFDTVEVARQRPDPMELRVKEVTVNDTPCKGAVSLTSNRFDFSTVEDEFDANPRTSARPEQFYLSSKMK